MSPDEFKQYSEYVKTLSYNFLIGEKYNIDQETEPEKYTIVEKELQDRGSFVVPEPKIKRPSEYKSHFLEQFKYCKFFSVSFWPSLFFIWIYYVFEKSHYGKELPESILMYFVSYYLFCGACYSLDKGKIIGYPITKVESNYRFNLLLNLTLALSLFMFLAVTYNILFRQ